MRKLLLTSAICLLSGSALAFDWGGSGCDPCSYEHRHRERIREIRREELRRAEWRVEHGLPLYPERERRVPERREWRERERIRDHDERCKPPLHAVGDADHLKEAAKASAIKQFEAQALNLYGERYLDYESAEVLDEHFDLAGLGADVITNNKRYVITARPCLSHRNFEASREGER